ncbi:MAG: ABC transporter, partial [Rhodospirillales bacterium]
KKLFDAWGIQFDPSAAVGDLTGAWRVRGGSDERLQAVNFVAWFGIRDGINQDDPATANLKTINVASPGALSKAEGASIEFTPLLTSSPRSALVPTEKLRMPEPSKILAAFQPDGKPRVLAARVRGVLKSAFTGPPELAADQKRPDNFPAHKAGTEGSANLVVVADTDILVDRYWVRVADFFGQPTATPFADNGPFVANLVGTLAGGDALIGLRSRGETNRPFAVIARMQSDAEANYRQTEQALQKHLEDVEKQLRTLRSGGEEAEGKAKSDAVITPEQRAAIDAARADIVQTRQKLRAVQLELNRDISRLQTKLRALNIALVPTLLTVLAIAIALIQRGRRARARA